MANFRGDSGPNVFVGALAEENFFDLSPGGRTLGNTDIATGGDRNDAFYFGAAFDDTDVVNGGAGRDQIGLQGDYSGMSGNSVTLTNVTNVEELILLPGSDARFGDTANNFYDYSIGTADSVVAAGQQFTVDGNRLRAGEDLIFDGRDETDGSFFIFGGMGQDILFGGAQNDVFFFRTGRYQNNDFINGGDGRFDQAVFRGDFAGANAVTIGDQQMIGVEGLVIISSQDTRFGRAEATPFHYDVTLGNGNTTSAVNNQFTVDAGTLRANETLTLDASANANGTLRIFGGRGADNLTGGQTADTIRGNAGNDTITGGLGGDRLDGGAGSDVLFYNSAAESTSTNFDTIVNFNVDQDFADLPTTVLGFSAFIFGGRLDQATFDSDLATFVDPFLEGNAAVTFSPDSGSFAGREFVIVDGDGDGNYTPGNDFVFEIVNPVVPIDPSADFFI